MADAIHGNTELGATKQDLIASVAQRELRESAVVAPTVMDVSRFAVKGAQSISFPKLDSFTAIDRASATAGDATVLTSTADKLDLDQCAYVAWIIDSCDAVQSTLDFQMEAARRAASAHARFVDSAVITELETVGDPTATTGDISKSIILEMREALCGRNANLNELKLLVGCDQESVLLGLADFVRPDTYIANSTVAESGQLGRIYGIPVVVSNLVAANSYYMYESSGIAIGFQQSPRMSDQGANEYGSGARRYALDQLFGVKGMQLGVNGVLATESALVMKDGNV